MRPARTIKEAGAEGHSAAGGHGGESANLADFALGAVMEDNSERRL